MLPVLVKEEKAVVIISLLNIASAAYILLLYFLFGSGAACLVLVLIGVAATLATSILALKKKSDEAMWKMYKASSPILTLFLLALMLKWAETRAGSIFLSERHAAYRTGATSAGVRRPFLNTYATAAAEMSPPRQRGVSLNSIDGTKRVTTAKVMEQHRGYAHREEGGRREESYPRQGLAWPVGLRLRAPYGVLRLLLGGEPKVYPPQLFFFQQLLWSPPPVDSSAYQQVDLVCDLERLSYVLFYEHYCVAGVF